MSLVEIESQLEQLTADELRKLAMKSWSAFVTRETTSECANLCDEEDSEVLAALDEALAQAEAEPNQNFTADEVRARIAEWSLR